MDRDEEIRRAQRAKVILEDDLVVEALAQIEATEITRLIESDLGDVRTREDAYLSIRAARAFRDYFGRVISDGKVAAARNAQSNRQH